jgi:hypothetical protein
MVSEAAQLPLAAGVKVTLIAQLLPAATELPQLLVWAKSPALAPESAMLVMPKAALPVSFSVMICAGLAVPTVWLAKRREEDERLNTAAIEDVGRMLSVRLASPVPLLFAAFRVTADVPATVGVPEINPVPVFMVNPGGNPVAP